jgi:hypothetical protein
MMTLQVAPQAAQSYAATKNAQYSNTQSAVRTIAQRWKETYDNLSDYNKLVVDLTLEQAKAEFRRRNPNLKKFKQMALAEAKEAMMAQLNIDGTMQRQLDIFWVLKLLSDFLETMVVPIQVYRPDPTKDEFLAWDGQHTLVLLWLIATHITEENPEDLIIPVNIYKSSLKAQMRSTFISLNSKQGKKQLEAIDLWQQMVCGVRIDGATDPYWVEIELKQQHLEKMGLFVTAAKFNDQNMPGAISRLKEIKDLSADAVKNLAVYLALATKLQRPVAEKEMVMMAHFFDRCEADKISVDNAYIAEVVAVVDRHWNTEMHAGGKFWNSASNAYYNWHTETNKALAKAGFNVPTPRFNSEPIHGFPYLIAQLQKSMTKALPSSDSNSPFWPLAEDLK